ncbi:fungal-specific transcription factor domain-containing protein [Mycena metata]|uniref:Fungal-specific transcription factor domain-containing protein n=1 Tax=Mycena metata TaxID=1033252 RepID=A0AAD7IAI9_9AGAR|nr:fungal-specific transcription factor domain-containing protein [Mycena metata]
MMQRKAQTYACDVCKKRKIRCDGAEKLGNRCSHCINVGADCTYSDLLKTSLSSQGYVAALEDRVKKIERLLEALLPGIDFTKQLENEVEVQPLLQRDIETLPRNDDNVDLMLGKLRLNPENKRFFGKSSNLQLLQTVLEFHDKIPGLPELPRPLLPQTHKRKEFWEPVQWVLPPPQTETEYKFPHDDLLLTLVDLYFQQINTCWPLLHRPTFEQKVADRLHLCDRGFAATLLLVISLGARHSDDPRIVLESGDMQSAGWEWYSQVSVVPKYLIYKPDLYELQVFALSAIFLQPLSLSTISWNQIGLGLRRAQEVGAHRRREGPPTAESEQWKRVFWVLLCLDWVFGTHSGRPLAMHTQDFDQDLPIDCDDEFWDLSGPNKFQQPKNKPSEISYFISYAKLLEIQAAVATTIYSPRRPKDLSGNLFPPQTESQSIVAFDSALNSWLSNIPEHLRWDPARENKIHLMQSAVLHTAFYNVQLLLHRPYIPAPFQVSPPGALPSLSIATNAARACIRIFDAYKDRTSELELTFTMLPPVFTAAIVLVLSTWSGRKTGFANTPQQLDQVRVCLRLMTELEKRYPAAGRYADIMNRLLYAGVSLDSLFDVRTLSATLPPLGQRSYETKLEAPKVGYVFFLLDWQISRSIYFEHQNADLGTLHGSNNIDVHPQYSLFNLDQLDTAQFPADGAVYPDADVMNMWSAAPSGFHLDDWSYIMSTDLHSLLPQLESLIPMFSGTPLREKETVKLHSEWNL